MPIRGANSRGCCHSSSGRPPEHIHGMGRSRSAHGGPPAPSLGLLSCSSLAKLKRSPGAPGTGSGAAGYVARGVMLQHDLPGAGRRRRRFHRDTLGTPRASPRVGFHLPAGHTSPLGPSPGVLAGDRRPGGAYPRRTHSPKEARSKWSHPNCRVLPVMTRKTRFEASVAIHGGAR
jgi:hypothetical protein